MNNFVPHLQEYEEQKLLMDARLEPLGKHLSMTKLKSPYVFNNIKYRNEDRFSTLFNSDNCYEDDRIKILIEEMHEGLVPVMLNNPILD